MECPKLERIEAINIDALKSTKWYSVATMGGASPDNAILDLYVIPLFNLRDI